MKRKSWAIGGRLGIGTCILSFFLISSAFAGGASPSGKTVNSLITSIQYRINAVYPSGTTSEWYPDAQMIDWINSAIDDIDVLTRCQESSERFTVDTGTSEYAMTVSYLYINDVVYQTGTTAFKTLKKGNLLDAGTISTGEPQYWYERAGKVGIYPLNDNIDVTASGNTLYAIYVPANAYLSGISTIPTPALFDNAIMYYVAREAYAKFGRMGMAGYFDQMYSRDIAIRKAIYDQERSIFDIIYPKGMAAPPQE